MLLHFETDGEGEKSLARTGGGSEQTKIMAAVNFAAMSLRARPELSFDNGNTYRNSVIKVVLKKRPVSVCVAANSPEPSPTVTEKPEIELEFIGVNSFYCIHFVILDLLCMYLFKKLSCNADGDGSDGGSRRQMVKGSTLWREPKR